MAGGSGLSFVLHRDKQYPKDKEDFIAQWKGSSIFVHPELPKEHEHGDIHLLGGDSILIEAWLNQSKIWMKLAVETSARANLTQENMAICTAPDLLDRKDAPYSSRRLQGKALS